MKWIQKISAAAAVAALILILLITSFEIACYADYGFYEKEYTKYQVKDDLEMEMTDIMDVTKEMMAYLRREGEDLVVDTVVDGQPKEFFNDREKAHMEDVQRLFLGGLKLRRIAIAVLVAAIGVCVLCKNQWQRVLTRAYQIGLCVFLGLCAFLAILCSTDFTKYFTIFHQIFFDNDLWLLDPKTDLLIRMLPEGFFVDMAIRIVLIFVAFLAVSLAASIAEMRRQKKKPLK